MLRTYIPLPFYFYMKNNIFYRKCSALIRALSLNKHCQKQIHYYYRHVPKQIYYHYRCVLLHYTESSMESHPNAFHPIVVSSFHRLSPTTSHNHVGRTLFSGVTSVTMCLCVCVIPHYLRFDSIRTTVILNQKLHTRLFTSNISLPGSTVLSIPASIQPSLPLSNH